MLFRQTSTTSESFVWSCWVSTVLFLTFHLVIRLKYCVELPLIRHWCIISLLAVLSAGTKTYTLCYKWFLSLCIFNLYLGTDSFWLSSPYNNLYFTYIFWELKSIEASLYIDFKPKTLYIFSHIILRIPPHKKFVNTCTL